MPDPVKRRVLLAIFSIISVYGLTIGYLHPLISLKMEAWGHSSFWIGVMGTMPFAASIFVSPMIPYLMRKLKVSQLVLYAICSDIALLLIMMIFENVYVWLACRFLTGVAGTILFVVSETWINEIAEDYSRGRVIALYTLIFSATFALSPLFIIIVGVEGKLPLMFAIVIIALGLIPLRWARGSSPDFSGGSAAQILRFIFLAPTLVCAAAVMSFDEAAVVTLFPIYVLRSGLTEEIAVVLLTVISIGSMVFQPLVGWSADKMNRYALIIICALVLLAATVSLPYIIQSRILVWPVMLIWGGALAGIYTVALVIMGQRFRGAQLAAGNAVFGLMWGVSGALAPSSAGLAMTVWGANGFVIVTAAAVALFLLVALTRRLLTSGVE